MSGQVDRGEEAYSRAGILAWQKYSAHQEPILEPGAWLHRLAYHVCIDLHRESKREPDIEVMDAERYEAKSPLWGNGPTNPERAVISSEMFRLAKTSIESLPPKLRIVMRLLLSDDSSYREMAHHLGISQAALRKRIQEARRRLRHKLSKAPITSYPNRRSHAHRHGASHSLPPKGSR